MSVVNYGITVGNFTQRSGDGSARGSNIFKHNFIRNFLAHDHQHGLQFDRQACSDRASHSFEIERACGFYKNNNRR